MPAEWLKIAFLNEVRKVEDRAADTLRDLSKAARAMEQIEKEHPDIEARVLAVSTVPDVHLSVYISDLVTLTGGDLGRISFDSTSSIILGSVEWGGSRFTAVGKAYEWAENGVQVESETTFRASFLT